MDLVGPNDAWKLSVSIGDERKIAAILDATMDRPDYKSLHYEFADRRQTHVEQSYSQN